MASKKLAFNAPQSNCDLGINIEDKHYRGTR